MAQIAGTIADRYSSFVSGTQAKAPNYSGFFCLVTFFILRPSVDTLSFYTTTGEISACLIHPIRPP